MKQILRNPAFYYAMAVFSGILLTLGVFSLLPASEANMLFFCSSDALYLPSLFRDLFIEGHSITDWHLNPAPNFFPDMAAYFAIEGLTGNFQLTTIIFSVLQYFTIGFLLQKVFKAVFPNSSFSFPLLILLVTSCAILEGFFYSRYLLLVWLILINSYHVGSFMCALFCLWMCLRYIDGGSWRSLLLIFCTGILAALSDRIFIVLFTAPVLFALMVLCKKIQLSKILLLSSAIILASGAGYLIFVFLNDKYQYDIPREYLDKDAMLRSLSVFNDNLSSLISRRGFFSLLLYIFLLSTAGIGFMTISRFRSFNLRLKFYSLFFLAFTACVASAPILTATYFSVDCLRYNIFPVYLSGLNCAVLAMVYLTGPRLRRWGSVTLSLLSVALFITAASTVSIRSLNAFLDYYPELARETDECASKNGLKQGVANYWVAKKVTMYSRKNIRLLQVYPDLSYYPHVTNDKWAFGQKFDFVILNHFGDTSVYRRDISNVAKVECEGELQLVTCRPFTYVQQTGTRVQTIP
jgi:hypothetical protein